MKRSRLRNLPEVDRRFVCASAKSLPQVLGNFAADLEAKPEVGYATFP
jgi:hypothetical protein